MSCFSAVMQQAGTSQRKEKLPPYSKKDIGIAVRRTVVD